MYDLSDRIQLTRKVDGIVDLKADHGANFRLRPRDEANNPVDVNEDDYTFEFSVDDTSILTLTNNEDGSGRVDATGTLGVATLSGKVTRNSDGLEWTGALAFNVVAGDAQTFEFEVDEPTETTPDQ